MLSFIGAAYRVQADPCNNKLGRRRNGSPMAKFVIEVTATTDELAKTVKRVIAWFSDAQDAFTIEYLDAPQLVGNSILLGNRISAEAAFRAIADAVGSMRGTHERIILFTPTPLDGERYLNLFSSVEENSSDQFTGRAIVTTSDVVQLTKGLPIEGYLVQQIVSICLRWVVGHAMLHEGEQTNCLFYKRIDKRHVLTSIKEMRLCDKCRKLASRLDEKQLNSLKEVMHSVSTATNTEDPSKSIDQLLASRKLSRYHPYSWRNLDKTLVEDVIDNWRRFRKGKSRYTLATLLALGGIAIVDPPFWQQMLEMVLSIPAGNDPSVYQQVIGGFVIFLAFLLVVLPFGFGSEQS